jgi:hypothetical protein
VTPAGRRLAALAALFAPERPGALLAGLGEPEAGDTARRAEALAARSRRERLAALAEALAPGAADGAVPSGGAPGRERPRVAEILRRVRSGIAVVPGPLRRLCIELLVPAPE